LPIYGVGTKWQRVCSEYIFPDFKLFCSLYVGWDLRKVLPSRWGRNINEKTLKYRVKFVLLLLLLLVVVVVKETVPNSMLK
jgi:hypothetical protein